MNSDQWDEHSAICPYLYKLRICEDAAVILKKYCSKFESGRRVVFYVFILFNWSIDIYLGEGEIENVLLHTIALSNNLIQPGISSGVGY